MLLEELSLVNFRNYERLDLADLGELVVFCGANAVGKTNILEAVSLLTAAESFRHPQIAQLVRKGCASARIQAKMGDGNRQVEHALSLEPGKKRYSVNGKARAAADVKGTLPAVSFVPDDLELAKKSSSVKRAALDDLGVQLSKSYDVVRRDYDKALRYKNRLLKDEAAKPLLDAINETLLAVATQLYCYRRSLFERMVPLVSGNYAALALTGEAFEASYVPSWLRLQKRQVPPVPFDEQTTGELSKEEVRNCLERALECFGSEEERARRALVGPHNDQILFSLSGADASAYASQGQQRSIVLAWKLAEVSMAKRTLQVNPVLLLDDVMSELDATRRALLVKAVEADAVQTFVTTTDLSSFDGEMLERARVITLKRENNTLQTDVR